MYQHSWNPLNSRNVRNVIACLLLTQAPVLAQPSDSFFATNNLMAWCIVPFDATQRTPQQRAEMLKRLGVGKLAYDYRAEHVPSFEKEILALKANDIELTAWWFPTTLTDEAKLILRLLDKHQVKTQLWVTGGGGPTENKTKQQLRVSAEANRIRLIAEAAAKVNCKVGLYNHGGWFGEPKNQIAIIRHLKLPNVGMVYNQHHGHGHVDRFPELLQKMRPHLYAINLNGMSRDGDKTGSKILPIGAGELDLELLKAIQASGYRGPIGILNHTQHDAESRLRDNLAGLAWIRRQIDGADPKPRPRYQTWKK